jgi:hypothetical protein
MVEYQMPKKQRKVVKDHVANFMSRVGRQRGALLPFSVGPSPNPCLHLSAHTALQLMTATRIQVLAHLVPFILSPVNLPVPLPHVSGITLSS